MAKRLCATAAAGGLALLASCLWPSDPPLLDVVITTDTTEYIASPSPGDAPRHEFRVISRFENRGTGTLYLDHSIDEPPRPRVSVTSAVPGIYSGYAGFWFDTRIESIVVAPGEVRIDTFQVRGPTSLGSSTRPQMEGSFQLSFQVRLAPAGEGVPLVPLVFRVSNAFQVRTAETP